MQQSQKEIHDLKRLLTTTRLTALDRQAIEARIEELSPSRRNEERPQARSPYLLGVFDRPKPSREATSDSSGPQPQHSAAIQSELQPPREEPEVSASPSAPSPPTPEEIERIGKQLLDIAERIVLLRSVWASTLSTEVGREEKCWLAKLQELAKTIPRELAEQALGPHIGLPLLAPSYGWRSLSTKESVLGADRGGAERGIASAL